MELGLLIIIIILSIAIINSLVLIIKDERCLTNNKMLGWSLLIYNIFFIVYFVWFEAGYIKEWPHMLRTVSPLMYLSAPFFYFYIRNSLEGTKGLRPKDWLHFLPAVIHFLELIPFYLQSYETKMLIVEQIIEQPYLVSKLGEGMISMSFHYLFRSLLQVIYFLYSVVLVYKIRPKLLLQVNRDMLRNWLFMSLMMMGWVTLAHFGYSILDVLVGVDDPYAGKLASFFSRVSLLGVFLLNLYINFNPAWIYSYLEDAETKQGHSADDNADETAISPHVGILEGISNEDLMTIKIHILELLEEEKIHLQKGLNLYQFSKKLGISSKLLSAVINKLFEKGFNELINSYRVEASLSKLESGYFKDRTIESLAEEAGFNSRITFFNAFKKQVGCGPNEYWKKFQTENQGSDQEV